MTSIEDRVRAGLWGHLVADALGVPHEFKAPVTERVAMVMPLVRVLPPA
jgi:ADP-ribosylglycohydrolase